MNISREQIKFIDTYLINSDIQFIDVRMEMVDHVASAVEKRMEEHGQTFYNAFKDFMVMNKRDLTKEYEGLRKKLQLTSFRMLWPALKKPWMLLLFIGFFLTLNNYDLIVESEFPYTMFVWGLLIASVLIYFITTFPKKKYRFSSLEALAWPLSLSSYVLYVIFNVGNYKPIFYDSAPYVINLFAAFYLCFNIAFLITLFKIRKSYKLKFA